MPSVYRVSVILLCVLAQLRYAARVRQDVVLRVFSLKHNERIINPVTLPDGTLTMSGALVDLFDWTAKFCGYRYKLLEIYDTKDFLNTLQNQIDSANVSNMIGTIHMERFDVLMGYLVLTDGRVRIMDMPVFESGNELSILLIPYPSQYRDKLWAFILPFRYEVWLVTLFCILVTGSVFVVANYFRTSTFRWLKDDNKDPFWYILEVILAQGGYFVPKAVSLRILAGSWCFVALILSNVYLSLLVTQFAAPNRVPVVQSFEDVANRNVQPVMTEGSYVLRLVQSAAKDTTYGRIAAKLGPEQTCPFSDENICLQKVISKGAVFFQALEIASSQANADFEKDRICRVTVLRAYDDQGRVTVSPFILPRNSLYTKNLTLGILHAVQYGLVKKWKKKHSWSDEPCKCCNWKKDRPTRSKFSLSDMSSAFVVLALGFSVSVLTFLLEIARKRWSQLATVQCVRSDIPRPGPRQTLVNRIE